MCRVLPVSVLLVVVFGTSAALAQSTATMLGIVSDESGAVLPGVALTARNVETGLLRTTVTGDDGSFRLAALPVGSYELRAELSGFQSAVRTGLTLTVAQEAVVNVTLPLGGLAETLTVVGAATLGLLVGGLALVGRRIEPIGYMLPTICAFLVAYIVFTFNNRWHVGADSLRALEARVTASIFFVLGPAGCSASRSSRIGPSTPPYRAPCSA